MSNKTSYEDQLHAIQSIMSDDLINFIKNNADDADAVRQRLQEDHILVDGEISDKHQKILDLRLNLIQRSKNLFPLFFVLLCIIDPNIYRLSSVLILFVIWKAILLNCLVD